VDDIQEVIESAIGGTPIGTTIEGRNRFSISVRYPQDLRNDVEKLRRVLVPLTMNGGGGRPAAPMGTQGSLRTGGATGIVLAQAMPGMDSPSGGGLRGAPRPRLPGTPISDAPMDLTGGMRMNPMAPGAPGPSTPGSVPPGFPGSGRPALTFIPLGQLADIRITGGPPMVRNEAGLLVGYVYVDIDQGQRDMGGYVDEAKAVVGAAVARGELKLPQGSYLKWTGQYEQLEQMVQRMKVVVPVTLAIVVLLLFLQFRSFAKVLIVLLSIPFALVGSVWLMYLLDYRLSTAVWVGIIALVGLAAQTGIVMIVYIDNAFERRRREGRIHDLSDIVAAHMEGTVQRVRPKLMTVSTMLIGLVPLLWATSSGADVMKRIAAPMVGGLVTSAFLTLEIIPAIVTYWRYDQLLWQRLAAVDPDRLTALRRLTGVIGAGAAMILAVPEARLYVALPGAWQVVMLAVGIAALTGGIVSYRVLRPGAQRLVWPERA
jgi:hypothetical protein